MTTNNKVKLVTHWGGFHADDIFATATLELYLEKIGKEFVVIRTRDEEIFKSADYLYDVGGEYDPDNGRFDHHQNGGAGKHDNGIDYASFGLVWKKFGEELSGNTEVAKLIEKKVVIPVDAGDNAITTFEPTGDTFPYLIQNMFFSFYPSYKDESEENYYKAFMECVKIAKQILSNEIALAKNKIEAREKIQKIYNDTNDKRILVMDEKYPYGEFVQNFPEPIYVVYPRVDNLWGAKGVSINSSFKIRKDFPSAWAGLRDEELQKVSGVPDATFCHRALFMAVAKSKEGAIKLAQIALES